MGGNGFKITDFLMVVIFALCLEAGEYFQFSPRGMALHFAVFFMIMLGALACGYSHLSNRWKKIADAYRAT
jgi:hypothetical protein